MSIKGILMQLYKELNIMDDKKLYYKINLFSLVVLMVITAAVFVPHLVIYGDLHLVISSSQSIWAFGIFLISIPLHECFHVLFFKLFSKTGKVKYGFSKGMFYATNPGVIYTKRQFTIIMLAPFVFNSLLFFLLALFGLDSTALWIVFILHTASCAGDFWYIYEIIKHPAITHCEDTPTGIKLLIAGALN